jgi:hypothetical protein
MTSGLQLFTLVHVAISLVGIVTGFVVLAGLLTGRRFDMWTAVFLTATVATSVTGFMFPVHHLMPSHVVGTISLLVLAVAIYARYPRRLAGGWRKTYVITAMIALYLNCFVAIVQSFLKIPALKNLAPTQTEPPFIIAQLMLLLLFVLLIIVAIVKFKDKPQAA